MRNKVGTLCMCMGTALVLGALALFLWNYYESTEAKFHVTEVLPQIHQKVQNAKDNTSENMEIIPDVPVELLTEEDLVMTELEIEGYPYIGYLAIPDLNLELPVMADWSYPRLHISPCRYAGTARGEDLVILAHNYKSHFGNLSKLSLGASVMFTDMDGRVWNYEIVAIDVLEPVAVEEMTAGEYDLTLFTCTPGGSYRVTVRCDLRGS